MKNHRGYDELCAQWDGDHCDKCLIGAYLNKITGKCCIKDPYCKVFDENNGICDVCRRGYDIKDGQCVRKW